MGNYVLEADINDILNALEDNYLFYGTFNYRDGFGNPTANKREEWHRIITEVPFEEIYFTILDKDCFNSSLTAADIVFCMYPEMNKSNENLQKIYDLVGYQAHGNEQPVFFVDNSYTSTRTNGTLFTTKGIYRKNKGMIAYSPGMPVKVEKSVKELYIKNTRVLSYNGTKKVFEDIVDLANIVYIFNCIRHETGENIYNKDIFEGVWKKDSDGKMTFDSEKFSEAMKEKRKPDNGKVNDKGLGDNSSQSGCLGFVILVIIIIGAFKSCS